MCETSYVQNGRKGRCEKGLAPGLQREASNAAYTHLLSLSGCHSLVDNQLMSGG